MPFGLFRRKSRDAAQSLYAEIVAQARQPEFYQSYFVPDTIDGRYDMITLHAVLLFRRLRGEAKDASRLSQSVFDTFFSDMDASLRELGVSDVRVGKKIGKMAEAFYGRADAYVPLLDQKDQKGLALALQRNIWPEQETPEKEDAALSAGAMALAAYMIETAEQLAGQSVQALSEGVISFGTVENGSALEKQDD